METKTEQEVPETSETGTKEVETEQKRISVKEIVGYLAEKFPECFSAQGPAKPLKVGIFQDLAERLADDEKVSKTRLRQALRHYTSSWRYLKSVKAGAHRVDVDGKEVAEIDQEQADYAAKTLKESQEKFGNKNTKDAKPKKPYKGKSPENKGERQPNKGKERAKFKNVSSSKRAQSKVAAKLIPITSDSVAVGKAVKVQLGNAPMDAVITEVSGDDVTVQLSSGMVVKTQSKNIFTE